MYQVVVAAVQSQVRYETTLFLAVYPLKGVGLVVYQVSFCSVENLARVRTRGSLYLLHIYNYFFFFGFFPSFTSSVT